MSLTLLSLWVHVLIVTGWVALVGFDVFAAAAPGLTPGQRARMITWSRPLVIAALVLIMLTGIRQTMDNPFLAVNSWATLQELKDRTYGLALFWKHGFVLATFALTVVVKFLLAPRLGAGATVADSAPVATSAGGPGRLILWASLLNLAACAGALIMTTRMVWELH